MPSELKRSKEFWKRYRRTDGGKLGEGRYGSVVQALDIKTGRNVAVKRVNMEDEPDDGLPSTAMREITLLRCLQGHPHIVNLCDVFYEIDPDTEQREINIVLEHLSCDLKRYLARREKKLEAPVVKSLMCQLCSGVQAMHVRGMFHRDLKPHNILLDTSDEKHLVLKIGDLGLGRTHALPIRELTHEIGSLHYRAPEILLGLKSYSHAVDIWSTGCIFAELMNGEPLFRGTSEYAQILKIFEATGVPSPSAWPSLRSQIAFDLDDLPNWNKNVISERMAKDIDPTAMDLLQKMLALNPSNRITIVEAMNHPYFTSQDSEPEVNTPLVHDVNYTPSSNSLRSLDSAGGERRV